MIKYLKKSAFAVILSAVLFAGIPTASAQNSERILQYHSGIEVFADSSMVVTETIRVTSTGDQIKRGIYRDFPIAYEDQFGHRYLVGFEILEVTRDGQAEPYHTERSGNGQRIYIGEEDVLIPPGEYEYAITYKTERQLGFYDDHDELYWNATGNGWAFPIDQTTASVKLPGSIPANDISAILYTGAQGSVEQNGTANVIGNSLAEFEVTAGLSSYEGLTIVVSWPKGIVAPPSEADKFWATVKANSDYIAGMLGVLLVLWFYFHAWNKHGRDPKKGVVIAQYEAPAGLSPAFMRYIRQMGGDDRSFAAAIINLGVKRKITITEEKGFLKKTTYTLAKKEGDSKSELSSEEQILMDKLFASGETIKLETKNATAVYEIKSTFFSSLKKQAGKKYFTKNYGVVGAGVAFSGLAIIMVIVATAIVRYQVGSALYVFFWIGLILALISANIIFGNLMRAFTVEGRRLADEIDGFKLFLNVTEKDRLAFHNPPERTPELFEKMLPYALALGVEHEWARQFSDVFARLQNQGVNYAPLWYYGSLAHFSPNDFASNMGSTFTGVVASASTPPGSSSGSGGSSGGGGGGGGGGGW